MIEKLYLDTEFNGFAGELISIAIVPEDMNRPELYMAVEFDEPVLPWVQTNVMPYLEGEEVLPREQAARYLASYLRQFENPIIYADWPDDLRHMLGLLTFGNGMMAATPDFDLGYRNFRGFSAADLSPKPHHALWDARALRDFAGRS